MAFVVPNQHRSSMSVLLDWLLSYDRAYMTDSAEVDLAVCQIIFVIAAAGYKYSGLMAAVGVWGQC